MLSHKEKIRTLYQKGLSAFQSKNWNYAVTLFAAVLDICPEHAPARTNLRLAEFRIFENSRFRFWSRIKGRFSCAGAYIRAFIFSRRGKWAEALNALEVPLRYWPKNISLLYRCASTAERGGFAETACGIYETMYVVKPADIRILKRLAALCRRLNMNDKARMYYERAAAIAPSDYDIRKGIQDIAAIGTIKGGWGKEGTYRDKIRDKKQSDLFEKEKKTVQKNDDKIELIEALKEEIRKTPVKKSALKKLASLYGSAEEYDKAIEIYRQAGENDPDIREEIFKIKKLKFKDNPESLKQVILEEAEARVRDFPAHLPARYSMGVVYMKRNRLDEAIAEFQLSVKDPKYKIPSLCRLGTCFYKKGIYDLAANQFKKADSSIKEWDNLKKEAVYSLGMVYEAEGDIEKANAEYKRIYEQDINYRDVAKKITTGKDNGTQ